MNFTKKGRICEGETSSVLLISTQHEPRNAYYKVLTHIKGKMFSPRWLIDTCIDIKNGNMTEMVICN